MRRPPMLDENNMKTGRERDQIEDPNCMENI